MSIRKGILLPAVLLLLGSVLPMPTATANSCSLGPGDDACVVWCYVGSVLTVSGYGGIGGAIFGITCGGSSTSCIALPTQTCTAPPAVALGNGSGRCFVDDLDDPTHADATGSCATTRVDAPGSLNPCPDQPVHTYGSGGSAGGQSASATGGDDFGVGIVTVTDTNTGDCGTGPAGWDGDYDSGVGGAAFGYGAWAQDPDCNYLLNVHGPNVAVFDVVFGSAIGFVVGESDQGGPIKVIDPETGAVVCETDGSISPCPDNDPTQCGPTDDPDDYLTEPFFGEGVNGGTGGGDGLYWVFLSGFFVDETTPSNPPTAGTITAF